MSAEYTHQTMEQIEVKNYILSKIIDINSGLKSKNIFQYSDTFLLKLKIIDIAFKEISLNSLKEIIFLEFFELYSTLEVMIKSEIKNTIKQYESGKNKKESMWGNTITKQELDNITELFKKYIIEGPLVSKCTNELNSIKDLVSGLESIK